MYNHYLSRNCLEYKYTNADAISFIHSFIETYIAPLQESTTQKRSQPSHGQRRTWERCKIWRDGLSEGTAAQREDHSTLMDPQLKRPFAA